MAGIGQFWNSLIKEGSQLATQIWSALVSAEWKDRVLCFKPQAEVYIRSKQELRRRAQRYIHPQSHTHRAGQSRPVLDVSEPSLGSLTCSWRWARSCTPSCFMPLVDLQTGVTPSLREAVWSTPVAFSVWSFFCCCPLANLSQASNTYNMNSRQIWGLQRQVLGQGLPLQTGTLFLPLDRNRQSYSNSRTLPQGQRDRDLSQLRLDGEKTCKFFNRIRGFRDSFPAS